MLTATLAHRLLTIVATATSFTFVHGEAKMPPMRMPPHTNVRTTTMRAMRHTTCPLALARQARLDKTRVARTTVTPVDEREIVPTPETLVRARITFSF